MFKNASLASEADKLLHALSCTKKPWLLNRCVRLSPSRSSPSAPVLTCLCCRYLHYCLDPDKIRKQDAISTIVSISNNAVGQPLAWDFVRAKWDDIVA